MTVSSAVSKLSYNGDGTLTPRATPQFVSNSDIVAILRDASDVETTWVEDTDYTLTGAGVASGGTLTPIATPPAVGEKLIIFRDPPIVQGSKYPLGGPFPSPTVEANVDGLTFMVQRLDERADRTLNFPETDTLLNTELPSSTLRANKFFGFDTSGNPTAVAGTSANLGPVSSYIDTLLPAANDVAARAILVSQEDVITTRGDLVVGNATPAASRLAIGAAGQRLESNGTDLLWVTPAVDPISMAKAPPEISNNSGDATNSIDIAAGKCRDDADTANLTLASAVGKQLDVSWAAGGTPGAPTGGLSSSLTLTNDTWYAVILGLVSGTAEVGFDTSATGANLVTNHSFTNTRRIGWVRRGTATNLAFRQSGDNVWLDARVRDINAATISTTAASQTVTAPPNVDARMVLSTRAAAAVIAAIAVSALSESDAVVTGAWDVTTVNATGARQASRVLVTTDGSSQIRIRAGAASTIGDLWVLGWVDRRGRDG